MNKLVALSQKIDSHVLENLFSKISLNDSEAFQELYELTKSSIYGYSLSILKNHEDALDNMQDVFVKIYESLENYQYKNKPMNWIFTITKNLALMKLRKTKKETNNEIKEEMLTNHNLCEEDKIIIKTLMEKLTDEERQIIIMHVIGGLKHIEIAKLLDIKLSTALSKYHRAIKKLKAEWRKN